MNPELALGCVSGLAGFLLKTLLAFGVTACLVRLAGSPSRRFLVWLSFLYGSAAYWLWLAKSFLEPQHLFSTAVTGTVQPAGSSVHIWQIPPSWAFPLSGTLRAVGVVYVVVVGYLVFSHIKDLRQLRWLLGFAVEPPQEVADAFQPIAKNLHVSRSRLLVLSGATSPATIGWIRPTVVLPDACLEQDRFELESILRHELHHIRRRDFLWNWLAVACRGLLFFHPAAWYAVRKMQLERELACDLAVVSDSPSDRASYAECLIRFARLSSTHGSKAWGVDFAASSEQLKVRVHSILAGSKKLPSWLISLRVASALTLIVGFLGVEPSLGVLVSYAQQQVSQSLGSQVSVIQPGLHSKRRTGKGAQLSKAPVRGGGGVPDPGQTTPATAVSGDSQTDNSSFSQSGVGPQLLRRGSPAAKNAKQQSVILIDSGDSGKISKSGDLDRSQALKQTAIAVAGIYKGLSAADRH